jgi:flavin reductase (DIM6/NTAB) family NADH-FMN oxidoreductase RutF
VIGDFATGVAIVTTEQDGAYHGMTVNSLTSVSLDPLLLLVCLTKGTRTATAVRERGAFAVNLLGADQAELSDRFARPGDDHFTGCDVAIHRTGLPVIAGALARLSCEVDAIHPGGDHIIVVGRVLDAETCTAAPLIFHRGRYDALTGQGREAALAWYW